MLVDTNRYGQIGILKMGEMSGKKKSRTTINLVLIFPIPIFFFIGYTCKSSLERCAHTVLKKSQNLLIVEILKFALA